MKLATQSMERMLRRKVIDRMHETHRNVLDGKDFTYDEGKSLFTVDSLPRNRLESIVVLEDVTSNRNNGNASPVIMIIQVHMTRRDQDNHISQRHLEWRLALP